jgi:rhodanese-related sulfurtransferase
VFSFLRHATPEIGIDELEERLREGDVRLLDVREEWEFRRGHVPEAVHVPLRLLPERAVTLPRGSRYAVICQSGSRSRGATDFLIAQGFTEVVSVRGGTGAWARAGRPLA